MNKMKIKLKTFCGRTLAGLSLFAATTLTAMAGAFQPGTVISEPAWVVHLDADALRDSRIGKALLAELDKPDVAGKFVLINAMLTFDPRKSLHGITLYSSTSAQEDGVALVYADFDAARLISLAESASDHQVVTNKGRALHNWANDKSKDKDGDETRTWAAIHDGKVVVFAQKQKNLLAALDVLAGTQPALKNDGHFPKPDKDSGPPIIFAVAHKLEIPGNDAHAAIFKQAKHMSLSLAASDANLTGKLSVATDTEDSAQQVSIIAQGLLALLSLQKENPQATKLAHALAIKQDGANVEVRLKVAVDDAVEMIKAGANKSDEKDGDKDKDKEKSKN